MNYALLSYISYSVIQSHTINTCMITQSQSIMESQIHKLRSMSVPQNYHQIVHRIFDKKLRSFLGLETKEEVLQSCQELLINKTIDYMNITNQLQSNQLKNLNVINKSIIDKDNQIKNLKDQIMVLSNESKEQKEMISKLTINLQLIQQELKNEKASIIQQSEKYRQIIREQEKNILRMKSEQSVVKSSLQAKNKELEFQIGLKSTEIRNILTSSKEEVLLLKSQKQKNDLDYKRKEKDMQVSHQEMRQQLTKDKKYLQDLLQLKQDDLKKKLRQKYQYNISSQLSLTIKCQKQSEKEKQKLLENQKSKETIKKKKQDLTIRSRSKSTRSKHGKSVTFDNEIFNMDANLSHKFPTFKQEGIQCRQLDIDLQQRLFNKNKKTKNLDMMTQTILQQPENQGLTEEQIKFKQFIEQRYKIEYDARFKKFSQELNQKMKQQLLDCLRLANQKISSLKLSTIEMIEVQSNRLAQIQQIYEERPSRQQDLVHIQLLIDDIQTLKTKCYKANTNADNAYIALQQYHVKLQNYKQSVPINIVGNIPPKINKKKSLRLQLERKPSIRNMKMSSTCSNYFEKHHMSSDSQNLTRELLLTQCDSDMMSPLFKKNIKSRPNTGGVTSKFRRKSIV